MNAYVSPTFCTHNMASWGPVLLPPEPFSANTEPFLADCRRWEFINTFSCLSVQVKKLTKDRRNRTWIRIREKDLEPEILHRKHFNPPVEIMDESTSVYFKTLRTSLTLDYRFQGKTKIYTLSSPFEKRLWILINKNGAYSLKKGLFQTNISNCSMAALFYTYPFTITITYFSLPSKTNKQNPCLLLKYHLFFTLIYCPLATSPLVPGQVIRLPQAALAGEGHRTAAQEACTGPTSLQSALYVSTAICPAVSPWAGEVLKDACSLPPPAKALSVAPGK